MILLLAALWSLVPAGATPPNAGAVAPEFSPAVYTAEKLSVVSWQNFELKLHELYRKLGLRNRPDAGAWIVGSLGQEYGSLEVVRQLSANATVREVGFRFISGQSVCLLGITARTFGHGLTLPSSESIRDGRLPWYPDGDKQTRTEIRLWVFDRRDAKVVVQRLKTPDGGEVIRSDWYDETDGRFLSYEEQSRTGFRHMRYVLGDPGSRSGGITFDVTRHKTPDEILGSETYLVNGLPAGATGFNQAFQRFVLEMFQRQWDGGLVQMIEWLEMNLSDSNNGHPNR